MKMIGLIITGALLVIPAGCGSGNGAGSTANIPIPQSAISRGALIQGNQLQPTGVSTASRYAVASVNRSQTNCLPSPDGTGLLSDGDFSQATYPGGGPQDWSRGQTFAPAWTVTGHTIDFYGSAFQTPNALCSVDLDGTPGRGGIIHSGFATAEHHEYTVKFLFSGNGACGPTVKTMGIQVGGRHRRFTWDISNNNNAQNGNFVLESWSFDAKGTGTKIHFISDDPNGGNCGPVVAAIAIRRDR